MPLETTPWNVTDYLTCERNRFGFLLACVEEAPDDTRFFAKAVKQVLRSRLIHKATPDVPLTRQRILRKAARYPSVSRDDVERIATALGYDLSPPSAKRAAAKRAPRAATKSQRRNP